MDAMDGSSQEPREVERGPESKSGLAESEEEKAEEKQAVPLDTVDVAELQAFNERKAWIIEKTKYLESLTPLEPLRVDNLVYPDRAPGLPTLEEIKRWVKELRALEKETDKFDKVDLRRLRKTARAAANRHLTPEDTDLVDLTLSTLLALDHLLEAIQQRSEQLDLFAHRVRWEDQRTECEQERRTLLADMENFITHHARWSPTAYEEASSTLPGGLLPEQVGSTSTSTPPPPGRTSTPALSQSSSSRSTPTMPHPTSRSQRFQLGQHLAADASRLYMRAAHLRQSRVEVAGKLLDRLISLKKVPDQFLDEQDRLEDETDFLRRSVGEFALALAEQWMIADRVYSDCVKHQAEAQAIMADLGKASLKPPNPRLYASLAYRMSTLETRLSTTEYDVLVFRHIPQPTHASHPEQEELNERIAHTLAEELETAGNLSRLAGKGVREYHVSLRTLQRAEKIKDELGVRQAQLAKLAARLSRGEESAGSEGAAPDLTTEECLESGRHGAYMAAFSSLLVEVDEAGRSADRLIRSARAHLPALKTITLAPGYMEECNKAIASLDAERRSLSAAKEAASAVVSRFRTISSAWTAAQSIQRSCQRHQRTIQDGLEHDRWRPKSPVSPGASPPTPETPSNRSFADSPTPSDVQAELSQLSEQFSRAVEKPVKDVSPHIGQQLREHVETTADRVKSDLSELQELAKLWHRVREQASAMKDVMEEADSLDNRLSSLLLDANNLWVRVADAPAVPDISQSLLPLREGCSSLRQDIDAFSGSLASRIPFVSSPSPSASTTYNVRPPKSPASPTMPETPPETSTISALNVPFDPTALDEAVRSQINVRSATLNGGVHNLEKRMRLFDASQEVRIFEGKLEEAEKTMDALFRIYNSRRETMDNLAGQVKTNSIEEVKLALDALGHESEELMNFASGLNQAIDDLLSSPQKAYDNVARNAVEPEKDEIAALLKPRRSRLSALKARGDEILDNAAAALRELHGVSSQLVKRLSELEEVEAERLAAAFMAQEATEEPETRAIATTQVNTPLKPPTGSALETQAETAPSKPGLPIEASPNSDVSIPSVVVTEDRPTVVVVVPEESDRHADVAISENGPAEVPNVSQTKTEETDPIPIPLPRSAGSSGEGVDAENDYEAEDVFGQLVPLPEAKHGADRSAPRRALTRLRNSLAELKLEELAFCTTPEKRFDTIPSLVTVEEIRKELNNIREAMREVEIATSDGAAQAERSELEGQLSAAQDILPRLQRLATFSGKIEECDAGINDIISTMDNYAQPRHNESRPQTSLDTSRDRLRKLLECVSTAVKVAMDLANQMTDDFRVLNEKMRIDQTWSEVRDEANDRLDPTIIRTISSLSLSSMSSSGSLNHLRTPSSQKPSLSRESSTTFLSGRSSVLSASTTNTRRTPSAGLKPTSRSVSGPLPRTPASRLPRATQSPTPSSVLRQRTESAASTYSMRSRQSLDSATPVWARGTSEARRRKSSIGAEVTPTRPRNMSLGSSWNRTPRQSFGSPMLPHKEPPKKRPYVANPQNKLDVAVGNVINRLPVEVNVRPLPGYKDQSGKYYIGDTNPKPYFCRILRSQTVMVRVGGGWMELSKFIRGHFADLFRILPPGPLTPPINSKEPWISSATLLKAAGSSLQAAGSPTTSPITLSSPFSDPKTPSPSTTRGDLSSSTLLSFGSPSTSPGSPLASIQFLRKADEFGRLSQSPSLRGSTSRSSKSQGKSTPRTPIWRP